ncbi:phosphatase PAP2 family protein [Metapseudomonas resinovorans]|uniref:Acid phosphatase n=1 Tax=Metapseudomonas resinovorans NBRC 106553 TaxID=1245471 RepID=S6AGR4_METRE|nr:phosphatase PAP2 family protein [Pseudomonas resinovorans]BAN49537.1 hypothetical protein PCA10_38050 [Pseudomonas resinovorans NBRC 106553]
MRLSTILLLALVLAHTASAQQPVAEIRPGFLAGYLEAQARPDSLLLVPPPPAPGTAEHALDLAVAERQQALRDTPRWQVAIADARLRFPEAAEAFSCALQAPIDEQRTPSLYRVLRRTLADAGLATYGAKNRYARGRPFAVLKRVSCTPEDEAKLAVDGAYPSGHSAIGWTWALLLSQLAPERGDALMARGRAFGESRLVCGVHWHSDVRAGREIGAATFARLQADPLFRADMRAAAGEMARLRAEGVQPLRDCAGEVDALAH